MGALGSDLRAVALAVEDHESGHLTARDEDVDDLASAAVAFVYEVPASLSG